MPAVTKSKPALKGEPALIIGGIASAVVALLAVFHVVIDVDTATAIITTVAPLVSALLIRLHVKPVEKQVPLGE